MTEIKDPYTTCSECVVKDWCKRRDGSAPLPSDYPLNPDCNGFILLEQAFKLANIPLEYKNANKRNYVFDSDNKEYEELLSATFDRVVNMVSNGYNIALFHPNKGTGKTRTAITIANEFIFQTVMKSEWFDFENPLALYVKYGKWANDVRQMYQIEDKDYNLKVLKHIEKMKKVPLLILDDIGSGRLTDIIRDLTYDIIDYRKENKKSTIFTSNMTIAELESEDKLSDLIVSRMMFNTVLYELGGRDRRTD